MSLNADLLRSRCAEIEESVRRLEQFQSMPLEEFLASPDAKDIACYRLLVGIEASLALCYHVSAKLLREVPEDYAQCFSVLGRAGLISDDLATRLQPMARFRNLLVHLYWKLDYEKVHEFIRTNLGDLRDFQAAMARLV